MLNLSASEKASAQTVGFRSNSDGRPVARVLICDDQHDVLTALSLLLKIHRYETEIVDSPQAALRAALANPFDLFLLDLNYSRDTTSGHEGMELLTELRARGVTAPIVVMTAWGNVELAVHAMRLGANDFVQKPWDNNRLLESISLQLRAAESQRKEHLRRRSELEIARHVQEKLLPQNPKKLEGLEYSARCIPAHEVGGDYYDIFDLGMNRMSGLLADVSGKGVAAAMLMANLQACFRSQIEAGRTEPKLLVETVNRLFHATTPDAQYATLCYFEYDESRRFLRYINCGHLAPVLLRSSGRLERLDSTSTVIGLFPECECECRSLTLNTGDTLVLFTDGLTEFLVADGTEFGEERLIKLLMSVKNLAPESAIQHVLEQVWTLRDSEFQSDDQTVLLMRVQ